MRKRKESEVPLNERVTLSMEDLQAYTGLGYPSAYALAEAAGAIFKIGRRTVFKREKIDEYLRSH